MKREVKYHIIYWIVYYVLISLIESGREHQYFRAFAANLITLPIKIIFVWLILRFLFDRVLLKNKIAFFLSIYFPLLFLFATAIRLSDNYIVLKYVLTDWNPEPIFSAPPFLYSVIKLQFAAAFPFAISLFDHWTSAQKRALELAHKNMEAELNLLRNQFSPHFLFNSLNTLYSRIVIRSDDAGELLLRLSSLLRFSLYEANAGPIPLAKEIQYISNYIGLQQARFGNAIEVSFTVYGDATGKMIEPFVIVPFVENSFKHCIHGTEPAWITIQVTIDEKYVIAQIDNSKSGEALLTNNDHHNGIGQANVKRRLELLYPDRHALKFEDGGENYFVYLKLEL